MLTSLRLVDCKNFGDETLHMGRRRRAIDAQTPFGS